MPVGASADTEELFPAKPAGAAGPGSETASDLGNGDDSVAPFDDDDFSATSFGNDASPSSRLEADTSADPSSIAALLRRAKTKLATVGAIAPALREHHVGEPALPAPDGGETSPTPQRPAGAAGGARRRGGNHVGFVAAAAGAADENGDEDDGGDALLGFGDEGDWDVVPAMDLDEAAANADSADGFGTGDTPGSATGVKAADVSLGDGFLSKLLAKRKSVTLLAGSQKRNSTFAGGDGDPFTAAGAAGEEDDHDTPDGHPHQAGTNRRTSTFFRARRRSFGTGSSRQGSFRRRSSSIGSRRSSAASSHFGSDGDDAEQNAALSSGGSSARGSAGGAKSFVDLMAAARRQGVETAEEITRNEYSVAADVEFEHATSLFLHVVLAEHSGFADLRAAAEAQIFSSAEFLRSRLQRRDEPAAREAIEASFAVGARLAHLEGIEEAPARSDVTSSAAAWWCTAAIAAVVSEEAIHRAAHLEDAWDALVNYELEPAAEELRGAVAEAQRAYTAITSLEAAHRSSHDADEAAARDLLVLETLAEPRARDALARDGLVAAIDVARTVCEVEESFLRESIEDAEWALAAELRRVVESLNTTAREGASELALLSRIERNGRGAISDDEARVRLELAACEDGPQRRSIAAEAVDGFHAIDGAALESTAVASLGKLFNDAVRDVFLGHESLARSDADQAADAAFLALQLQLCEAEEAVARHALKHALRTMVREDGAAARALALQAAGEVASKRAGQGLVHVQGAAEPHARSEIEEDELHAAAELHRAMATEHTALLKGSLTNAISALAQEETAARFAIRSDEDNGTAVLSGVAERLRALHDPVARVFATDEPQGRSAIAADERIAWQTTEQHHTAQARETNARHLLHGERVAAARKLEAHGAGLMLLATLNPAELRALMKELAVLEKREHTSRRHIVNEAEAERDALEHRISKKLKKQRRASVAVGPSGALGDAAVPDAAPKPAPPSERPPMSSAAPRASPGASHRRTAVGFDSLSIEAVQPGSTGAEHASSPPSSPRPTRQSPLAKKAPSSLKNKWDRVLRELAAVDDAFEKSTDAPTPMDLTASVRRRKSSARRRSSAAPSSPNTVSTTGRPPSTGRRPSTVNDSRGITTVGRRRSSVRPPPEPSPPPKSQGTTPGFRRKSAAASSPSAPRRGTGGSDGDRMDFDEPPVDLRLFSRRRSSTAQQQPQQSPQPAPPSARSPAKGSGASMRALL